MLKLGRRIWHRKNGLGTPKCWRLVDRLPGCPPTQLTTDCNCTRSSRRRFQERTTIPHDSLLETPLIERRKRPARMDAPQPQCFFRPSPRRSGVDVGANKWQPIGGTAYGYLNRSTAAVLDRAP